MVFGNIRIYQNNHTISLIKHIIQKWKNQGQISIMYHKYPSNKPVLWERGILAG